MAGLREAGLATKAVVVKAVVVRDGLVARRPVVTRGAPVVRAAGRAVPVRPRPDVGRIPTGPTVVAAARVVAGKVRVDPAAVAGGLRVALGMVLAVRAGATTADPAPMGAARRAAVRRQTGVTPIRAAVRIPIAVTVIRPGETTAGRDRAARGLVAEALQRVAGVRLQPAAPAGNGAPGRADRAALTRQAGRATRAGHGIALTRVAAASRAAASRAAVRRAAAHVVTTGHVSTDSEATDRAATDSATAHSGTSGRAATGRVMTGRAATDGATAAGSAATAARLAHSDRAADSAHPGLIGLKAIVPRARVGPQPGPAATRRAEADRGQADPGRADRSGAATTVVVRRAVEDVPRAEADQPAARPLGAATGHGAPAVPIRGRTGAPATARRLGPPAKVTETAPRCGFLTASPPIS
jgi:hypothetical protein